MIEMNGSMCVNPWAISSRDAVSERSERRVWSVVSSHDFICFGVKLGDGFVVPEGPGSCICV